MVPDSDRPQITEAYSIILLYTHSARTLPLASLAEVLAAPSTIATNLQHPYHSPFTQWRNDRPRRPRGAGVAQSILGFWATVGCP